MSKWFLLRRRRMDQNRDGQSRRTLMLLSSQIQLWTPGSYFVKETGMPAFIRILRILRICSYLFVSCQTFEGMPALFKEKWDKSLNNGTSLLSFCETALLSKKNKSTSQELLPLTFIHCGLPVENTNTMKIEETVRHNLPRTECWPGPNWPRRGQKYLQNCIQIWKRF